MFDTLWSWVLSPTCSPKAVYRDIFQRGHPYVMSELSVCSLVISPSSPGPREAKGHTARDDSSTEVTHHFSRKPETSPWLTRGPASHGHFKCHHAGPGSAHPGKVCRHPALRNNSPDQKPLMYREHLRKKNVFYVKKVKTLYTVSAALCKKWQSKESNIFKTFLKNNYSHGSLILY